MTSTTRPHAFLELHLDGPLARLYLDRPERHNAHVPSLWKALAEVAHSLPHQTRVVLISGRGPSFSSGLDRDLMRVDGIPGERDLAALGQSAHDPLVAEIASYQEGFAAWANIPQVTVAAVQGHALGAGLQLALACDLRIVADDVKLAMREASLGLIPDMGGTHPLVRLVGYARAMEMCLTGRAIGAAEAVAWGLASLSVPAAELAEAALDLTDAVLSNPAPAVRELKQLLRSAQETSPAQQLFAERQAQARLLRGMFA